jgi:hypothetical protein
MRKKRKIKNKKVLKLFLFPFIFFFLIWVINIIINKDGQNSFTYAEEKKEYKIIYSGEGYSNPFKSWLPEEKPVEEIQRLIEEKEGELPEFTVQGIVWEETFPQAIINNSVVKIGDKIEGAEILEIERDRIKLSYEGIIFFLSVTEESY